MNFETLSKEILPNLDISFRASLDRYFSQSPMKEMLAYQYQSGGKRLRPLLVFGAARAAKSGDWVKECMPYALAVELLHNATLIHDDIQDGDRMRRGEPTLWVKYSTAQAINCGDAWLYQPLALILDNPFSDALKVQLLKVMQKGISEVIEGQSQEFALKEKFSKGAEASWADYRRMVEGKTSALFELPLLGGALIAGAGGESLASLERAARHLGMAFQIQDDLLDLFGNKGRDQVGTDIAEGKISFPLLMLLSKDFSERAKVKEIIGKDREATSAQDIQFVLDLMKREGVLSQCKERFLDHCGQARAEQNWKAILHPVCNWLEEKVSAL